jgi:hypothetical protein
MNYELSSNLQLQIFATTKVLLKLVLTEKLGVISGPHFLVDALADLYCEHIENLALDCGFFELDSLPNTYRIRFQVGQQFYFTNNFDIWDIRWAYKTAVLLITLLHNESDLFIGDSGIDNQILSDSICTIN